MKNQKNLLTALCTLFVFALTITALVAQRPSLGGLKLSGFNYAVENMAFSQSPTGQSELMVFLRFQDFSDTRTAADYSFDIQVSVNGKPLKIISKDGQTRNNYDCYTHCGGGCSDILFGNGRCITTDPKNNYCTCDYGGWFNTGIGQGTFKPTDMVLVSLVPARKGTRDSDQSDNSKRMRVDSFSSTVSSATSSRN